MKRRKITRKTPYAYVGIGKRREQVMRQQEFKFHKVWATTERGEGVHKEEWLVNSESWDRFDSMKWGKYIYGSELAAVTTKK